MIEKIIVVAPTTAVPMSTGLAVALKVIAPPVSPRPRSLSASGHGPVTIAASRRYVQS